MNSSHDLVPEPREIPPRPPFHSAAYIDWLAQYGECADPGWCDIHGHESSPTSRQGSLDAGSSPTDQL